MQASLKEFFGSIAIFGGLDELALDRVVRRLKAHHYTAGEVVCQQDEPSRSMFILHSGQVLLKRTLSSGREIKMLRLGPGEFFGETTLIEMHPSHAAVTAETSALLYSLTSKDLHSLYREDVHTYVMVIGNLCRELSRRLRKAEQRVCERAEELDDEKTQIVALPLMSAAKSKV
jgi:CRP-like cAMP-binding protein